MMHAYCTMMHYPQHHDDTPETQALAASRRIRSWLLAPGVQLRSGIHAGAVAGSFAADGLPRYVYPEITGYYLHWLAESALADREQDWASAAVRACAWTSRQFDSGSVPLTRAYLYEERADWRNDAVFFFDFAMLLRGVCAAVEANLVPVPHPVLRRLVEELGRFADAGGEIAAARILRPGAQLPQRWSTLGGPFEVKAASRVLLAHRLVELPPHLLRACENLVDRFTSAASATPIDMLHPTLYFAEGLLVARPDRYADIGVLFERILRLRRRNGSLPEAESGSDIPRSDVLSQALRVGLQLRSQGLAGAPAIDVLASLAYALIDRVSADGSVCFRNDIARPEANVWCSMFAEQALRWFAWHSEGRSLPAAEWLV